MTDQGLRNKEGFTLLELIVVIFLITLVLGLSTVFFANGMSSTRLSATARELSATLRHARSLAQIHGEKQIVTIDLDSKYYGLEGKGNRGIPHDISVKVVDEMSGEIDKGKYQIQFDGAGTIEGGRIVLSSKKQSISIETDPIVGSVIIK